MKTMMNLDGTEIVRVSDEKASRLYGEGYKYIAKSIWKEKVRDVDLDVIVDEDTGQRSVSIIKSNNASKAQKRHARKIKKL